MLFRSPNEVAPVDAESPENADDPVEETDAEPTPAFDLPVLENGGFDIVIGNPPYGATLTQAEKDYITEHYETTEYNFDTYKTFFELGMNLLKPDGYLGFITPNTYFVLEKGGEKLRRFLFDHATLLNVAELFNVFPDAVVEPAISIFQKRAPEDNAPLEVLSLPRNTSKTANFYADGVKNEFTQKDLKAREGYLFNFRETKEEQVLRAKIDKISVPLGKYFHVSAGVKPYEKGKGKPAQTAEMIKARCYETFEPKDGWTKYIRGENIGRYENRWSGEYVLYGENLAAPRKSEMFTNPKLFVRRTDDVLRATFDDSGFVGNNSIHCVYPREGNRGVSLKFALALINSKLVQWVYQHDNFHMIGKPFAEVKVVFVERLPLPILDDKTVAEKIEGYADTLLRLHQARHDTAKKFVDYLVAAYKPKKLTEKLRECLEGDFDALIKELKAQKATLSAADKMELLPLFTETREKCAALAREINAAENALDTEIFKIYALTAEEIAIMERK